MRKLLARFAAVTTAFTHATTGKSITAAVGLILGIANIQFELYISRVWVLLPLHI